MNDTTLQLGDITLTGFEIPERVPFGGKQSLMVHPLVGGARVVDAMGAEPRPIRWSGIIFSTPDTVANARAQQIDLMRSAGQAIVLSWFTNSYLVTIKEFLPDWERFYQIPYEIECEVIQNLTQPNPTAQPDANQLVPSDLNGALTEGTETLDMDVPSTLPSPVSTYAGVSTPVSTDITWGGSDDDGGLDLTPTAGALTLARDAVDALPAKTAVAPDDLADTVSEISDAIAVIQGQAADGDRALDEGTPQGDVVGGVVPGEGGVVSAAAFTDYQITAEQVSGLFNVGNSLQRMNQNLQLANGGEPLSPISWLF